MEGDEKEEKEEDLGDFETVDEVKKTFSRHIFKIIFLQLGAGGEKNEEGEEENDEAGEEEKGEEVNGEETNAEEEKNTEEEKTNTEGTNAKDTKRRSKGEESKSGNKRSEKGKKSSEMEKRASGKKSVKESPRKRRERTPVDLDKIVIKKREKKQQEEKSTDEKVLGEKTNFHNFQIVIVITFHMITFSHDHNFSVVRTPNSLMGRLAELRKALPRPQVFVFVVFPLFGFVFYILLTVFCQSRLN